MAKQIWHICVAVDTDGSPEMDVADQSVVLNRLVDLENLLVTLVRARLGGLPNFKKLRVSKNGEPVDSHPDQAKTPYQLRQERKNRTAKIEES